MRTIGNIERFLVLGIVVVIGAILTVAITGARDLEAERSKQVAAKTNPGAPTGKKGDANALKRDSKSPKPPADQNGLDPGRGSKLDPAIQLAIDQQKAALEGKVLTPPATPTGTQPGSLTDGSRPEGPKRPTAPSSEIAPAPEPIEDHRDGSAGSPVSLNKNEELAARDPQIEPRPGQIGDRSSPPTQVPQDAKDREYVYEVRKGDTLERIARSVYGDGQLWKEILAANPAIVDSQKIKVGDKLKLPKAPTQADAPVTALDIGLAPLVKPLTPTNAAAAAATTTYRRITDRDQYQVQKGDTLMSIAAANYGTKAAWHLILDANSDKLADKDRLKTGMTLKLPTN